MSGEKVGVLGSGEVGRALAAGYARHGYDVVIGTREPEKLAAWKKETPGTIRVGSFAEAASHGPVVLVATLGSATEAVLDLAGPAKFHGKLVLDVTNPLDFSHGMPPGLFVGMTDSL